ncbi:hypothetical protein [Lapillicoccus sp.]|uniref:hypothetical protein n=1 Tax=Lapillicoccus sp. TaxID=1909287 RepID=UPI003262E327
MSTPLRFSHQRPAVHGQNDKHGHGDVSDPLWTQRDAAQRLKPDFSSHTAAGEQSPSTAGYRAHTLSEQQERHGG